MIWLFVISFIIILMSFLSGFLVVKFTNIKTHKFVSSIGFTVLLGVLQILYYPIQLYKLKTSYIYICTILVFLLIIILSLFNIRSLIKFIKEYKKYYKEIIFGLFLFVSFCLVYYFVKFPTRTDDLYFYIPYTVNKSKTIFLQTELYNQYDYQGFYDFVAFFIWVYSKLVSVNIASYILPTAVVVWVPSIVLYWILSFVIVDTMVYSRKFIKNSWLVSILISFYTFGAYWYLQTPYIGNSFRRVSLLALIYLIISIIDEFKWSKYFIIGICLFSLLAQTSTAFFFGAFILYSLMFYYAYKKEVGYLSKIVFLSVPLMIFSSIYVVYLMYYINSLYGLYLCLVVFKLDKQLEKFINKYFVVLMGLIPLLFGIWTRLPSFNMPKFNISYFDIVPNFFDKHAFEGIENLFDFEFYNLSSILISIFCILMWICIINYLYKNIKQKIPNDYLSFMIITIFLTFFNPWVIVFVMTYMTNVVYFRIYDLFFNIITLFMFLGFFFNLLNKKQSFVVFCIFLILIFNKVIKNQTWTFMGINDSDYNALYHTSQIEVDLIDKFNKEVLNNKKEETVVVSQIYSLEAFSDGNIKNIKKNIYTYGNDTSDEAMFQKVFYRYEPGLDKLDVDYLKACTLAKNNNVEYVIIEAQYNSELENGIGYCGEKVLEHGTYRVFKMHYDWLAWSMGN